MTDDTLRAPEPAAPSDSAAAYRMIYGRVSELLRGRAEWADIVVPACPSWTVRQTLSHLCGAAEDVATLNLEGVASDPWTNAQVVRHADDDIDVLLGLWGAAVDQVETLLPHAPSEPAARLVFDAVTHEHDIRGAIGVMGDRTGDPVLEVALSFMTSTVHRTLLDNELPSLLLTTEHGTWQLGDPDTAPAALRLEVSTFDVVRSLGGRRSTDQIRALPWDGDPGPLFAIFEGSPVRPTAEPLIE